MKLLRSLWRRKKKALVIPLYRQPQLIVEICLDCGHQYMRTLVEGNPFPLGCPRCGHIQSLEQS